MLTSCSRASSILLRLAPICALAATSCATVHSAFMTNVSTPAQNGRTIDASSSKFVFLAFNFDNEYAFNARQRLISACRGGTVTGILTTYETKWYLFFTDHIVKARGICVQHKNAEIFTEPAASFARSEGGAR